MNNVLNDRKKALGVLKEIYPHLPSIVLERSYDLWDSTRKLTDKERRKANRILDSLPDVASNEDYAKVVNEYTGGMVIEDTDPELLEQIDRQPPFSEVSNVTDI